MQSESISTETLLIILDVALLALLAAGVVALRRIRPPVVHDVRTAFQVLDNSIERFVPDMPAGYTWGEAVERLKGAGVKVDWERFESTLDEYEAFRYGGHKMPSGSGDEAVTLSMKIRGRIVGYRNKRKGTRPD